MRQEKQTFTSQSFDWKIWKRMAPFLKPYWGILIMVIALNLICSGVDLAVPLFQRYAIDHFIQQETARLIGWFAAFYAFVIALQAACVILFTRGSMKLEMRLSRDMKRKLFVHLQTLSFSYYNVTPVGYILARVMSDTNKIASLLAWEAMDVLWALTYVLGVFGVMLFLNWKLALVIMMIVPVIALLTVYFQKRILLWNRKVRAVNAEITGAYNEGIMGAKASKALVIEEKNSREFQEITQKMRVSSVKAARLNALYLPIILFFSTLATAVVLVQGGHMVLEQMMLVGTLSAFTSYAVGIFEPIQQLARVISNVISAQANIERVMGLLDEKPLVKDRPEVIEKYGDLFHPKKENWEPIKGDITFQDVSFTYPDGKEEVLSHFYLEIPAGTTVAIVGETGAGKSTLVNLVCRFFEPTSGQILIDGKDYRDRSQLWLQSNIGYVLQDPHLFSGSILENIRYGRLDATDEEVIEAAQAAFADKVAQKMENGYYSDVGEGGGKLSTGEKQLISFARAILADPRLFVLDEATSSIDTQTEQYVQEATKRVLEGRTSFLIAHRLSTIRHADLILVVRSGRIVEQGTHQELLNRGGYYFQLYSKQFQEELEREVLL